MWVCLHHNCLMILFVHFYEKNVAKLLNPTSFIIFWLKLAIFRRIQSQAEQLDREYKFHACSQILGALKSAPLRGLGKVRQMVYSKNYLNPRSLDWIFNKIIKHNKFHNIALKQPRFTTVFFVVHQFILTLPHGRKKRDYFIFWRFIRLSTQNSFMRVTSRKTSSLQIFFFT